MKSNMIGKKIYNLAEELFPINRSITGEGVRKSLKILKKINKNLKIFNISTGTKVFDWVIPEEWNVRDAWIKDLRNKKVVDMKRNNLHLMSYSIPVNQKINIKELKNHLYSIKAKPDAIPYVTSYYEKKWGFCLSNNQLKTLKDKSYTVKIDSKLKKGFLNYGEILIKGKSKKEIFLSTYICHPSMANNELSGPCVAIYLSKWLNSLKSRNYSYRIVFVPETIGSIAYLSKNYKKMKKNIIAGYQLTCLGDNRTYSFLPSRKENSLSDNVARHILKWTYKNYKTYSWLERGSDERQYNSPGIGIPVASIMRSKYGEYPEYHTSDDNLKKVVSPKGLQGGYEVIKKSIIAIENNCYPLANILCEPMLSKRNLYPSYKKNDQTISSDLADFKLMDFLSYCDGKNSLLEIAEKCKVPIWSLYPHLEILLKHKVIKKKRSTNS